MRKRIFAVVMALCVMCGFFVAASAQSVTRHSASSPFTGFIGPRPAIKSNVPALPTGKVTSSVRPPLRAEADAPVIYGSLIAGDGLDLSAGVYSFPASSDLTLTPVNIWAKQPANAGGVYVNGKYYYFHYFESSGALFTYFVVADASTWEILSSTRNRDIGPCTDLAYDPITETIYGCFSKSTKDGYLFGSVSKTGAVTQIAEMTNPLYTLACDVDGTLYAINSSGVLCTVDKENGKLTTVGSTGIRPDYVQSMTFDMASRRLFWAACTETSSGLYEIAPATGKATLIKKFDNGEEFCGIYTLSQGADAKAPGELTDFKAEYDITTLDGVNVSFKMPAKAFDGTALSGKIDWIISLDDKDLDLGEANPGETVTLSFSSGTVGMHTISAFARNSSGKGPQASERKWIGVDTPLPLENCKLTVSGDQATISWDAPVKAAHDGYFDPAAVNYRVIRQPGNVTVCQKTTQTSYTDKLDLSRLASYYYDVITYVGDAEGATTSTNTMLVGEAFAIPYSENFSNSENFKLFTVIDANKDGKTWVWEDQCAKSSYSLKESMNDWLITPPLKFEADYIYTLRFKVLTRGYKESFNVWYGTQPTVEGMTTEILETTVTDNTEMRQFEVRFRPSGGSGYLGFHHVSDAARFNFYLDDIEVDRSASVKAPAAIEDLTVTPAPNGALKFTVSFHAPAKNIGGEALTSLKSVTLYHGDRLIKTFSNPKPGDLLTQADIVCSAGANSVRAYAESSEGKGLEATADFFIGPDMPARCTNIHLEEKDGKAILTWDAPKAGHNGGYIDPTTLKFHVARQNFVTGQVEPTAMNLTECRFEEVPEISTEQESVAYFVYPVNEQGIGDGYASNSILFGTPYALPWKESFPNANLTYDTWRTESSDESSTWGTAQSGVYPSCTASDGDSGLISYQPAVENSWSVLTSGKISVKDAANPVVEFDYYHKKGSDDKITLLVSDNGVDFNPAGTVDMSASGDGNGWKTASFPIPAYGNKEYIQIAIRVDCGNSMTSVHIDRIVVRNLSDKDLAATKLTAPLRFEAGKLGVFTATVSNVGLRNADVFTVVLNRDGQQAAIVNGTNLAAGDTRDYEFTLTPDETYPDFSKYQAVVNIEGDGDLSNNTSKTVKAVVVRPILPVVTDLQGSFNEATSTVDLSWSAPDLKSGPRTTDTFENYNAFITENIGDWRTVDVDGAMTIFISGLPLWQNCTDPQAFIVFNPTELGIDISKVENTMFAPHSGDQMLVSFASYAQYNNDWIVSPLLSGNAQTISFWVRALTTQSGKESFEFLTTDGDFREDLESYVRNDEVSGEIDDIWTEIKVDVPAGTKYFAIRCTSSSKWGLCVDDITYTPAAASDIEFKGYNIVCNGQTLNNSPVQQTTYSQPDIDINSGYRFNIVCVYDKGLSAPSNEYAIGKLGLEGIGADNVSVTSAGGEIVITGAAGQTYAVYTPAGLTAALGVAAPTEKIAAAEGIYLVKVGDRIFKVAVRK